MLDVIGASTVGEAGGEAIGQPDYPIGCAQRQRAGIRGDRSAVKNPPPQYGPQSL
ncbi:hypothetical protein [Acidiphilium sp.]|uniref:hypothetical protein n=1 Tax=Acidiphilium sp. TaxID=527 RepID=UPI003D06184E